MNLEKFTDQRVTDTPPLSAQVTDRQLLAAIVDTDPDAYVIIDREGVILALNPNAVAIFGYSLPELKGENISVLMSSPDRERHQSYINRYLETGKARVIGIGRVVQGRRKDGTTFPLQLVVSELPTHRPPLFVGHLHDLSKRDEIQRELKILQSELAHIGRMSQASALASAIAHELNQPLAAIGNYVEAASALIDDGERALPGAVREALDRCAHEVDLAGTILRRWRSFVKTGRTERTETGLEKLLNEAIALALADGDGAGVQVSRYIDSNLPMLSIGKVEIMQVVVNLLRNALDSTRGQMSRLIEVSAAQEDGLVRVSVGDNGRGIDPAIAKHLFTPFHSSKPEGMGLGLWISNMIVEAHGGRLWAEPAAIGGACFHFTLPIDKEKER